MKATFKQINVGKLSNGQVIPYQYVTSAGLEFTLERERTVVVGIDAVDDFEGIEAWIKFEGDVIEQVIVGFEDKFDESLFDIDDNFDLLKQELWFTITEKTPGTQNFIGNYDLLTLSLLKERGRVHLYLRVTV